MHVSMTPGRGGSMSRPRAGQPRRTRCPGDIGPAHNGHPLAGHGMADGAPGECINSPNPRRVTWIGQRRGWVEQQTQHTLQWRCALVIREMPRALPYLPSRLRQVGAVCRTIVFVYMLSYTNVLHTQMPRCFECSSSCSRATGRRRKTQWVLLCCLPRKLPGVTRRLQSRCRCS